MGESLKLDTLGLYESVESLRLESVVLPSDSGGGTTTRHALFFGGGPSGIGASVATPTDFFANFTWTPTLDMEIMCHQFIIGIEE